MIALQMIWTIVFVLRKMQKSIREIIIIKVTKNYKDFHNFCQHSNCNILPDDSQIKTAVSLHVNREVQHWREIC